METRQKLFLTLIFIFENDQNSFSPPPPLPISPLWSIVVKYFNFEQKLPIGTVHHIFLESRHPEVTKNSYYVLYPKGRQKKVSANRLIPVCRCVYIHYFKINPPAFCCPLSSENYLTSQVRINKIVKKHTVDYQLSNLYRLLRPFLSRVFLEFSPNLVYSAMVAEKFQIYSVKITANTFVNQKIESVHFYSCPQAKLLPQADGNCAFLPNSVF